MVGRRGERVGGEKKLEEAHKVYCMLSSSESECQERPLKVVLQFSPLLGT